MKEVKGQLVSRSTKLTPPEGFKTVLVFGMINVPVDSTFGDNTIVNVVGAMRDKNTLELGAKVMKPLPKKLHMHEAVSVCRQLFGVESMYDATALSIGDEALNLIAHGDWKNPRLGELVTTIRTQLRHLEQDDPMRMIYSAVVSSYEKKGE